MLKTPCVGEGSGLHSHFGVLADLQFYGAVALVYGAVALELQAHGYVVMADTNHLERFQPDWL